MAERSPPRIQTESLQEDDSNKENNSENFEPIKKKPKVECSNQIEGSEQYKLEERLCGILCCAVCLDLPRICYQCINGHLMCAGCFNHLLADGRLKDETATCPNCRCEITKATCSRNLAVEKAASELPTDCQYCQQQLPRHLILQHEGHLCQERPSSCKYAQLGCPWRGPYHELKEHEENCSHPQKTGIELMDALQAIDKQNTEQLKLYEDIFALLSYEKITFNDLQLRPFRTDDFITKLFYETSRFSSFQHQWVLKARVDHDQKDPTHSSKRTLSYQLVLKSRTSNPLKVLFMALKGPYGDLNVTPYVYEFEFSNDSTESEYHTLPTVDVLECNKLLASKTINVRLVLFLVQQ
ncbi:and histidine-rich 1-like [Octopus vulgaris]|uniref:And histidine-rich 1-like n=2 Tax=Octopus TaxID=6643 RepID=A0AA36BNT4_OCTVU|nr:cysteine and histidine-rich protein 1 [Octopus sinensis]CAI9737399.1 and histidine-rich 1-like [Octopus vulgaris]